MQPSEARLRMVGSPTPWAEPRPARRVSVSFRTSFIDRQRRLVLATAPAAYAPFRVFPRGLSGSKTVIPFRAATLRRQMDLGLGPRASNSQELIADGGLPHPPMGG